MVDDATDWQVELRLVKINLPVWFDRTVKKSLAAVFLRWLLGLAIMFFMNSISQYLSFSDSLPFPTLIGLLSPNTTTSPMEFCTKAFVSVEISCELELCGNIGLSSSLAGNA